MTWDMVMYFFGGCFAGWLAVTLVMCAVRR